MLREVKTENGVVRGLPAADPRITSFKGIPFAAPPVGKNRWRAPQPAENWEGVRECFEWAPISMQDTPGLGTDIYCREWHVDPEVAMDEDCLYLNVWTPAKKADEKLPVLVWYFGGALQWGYPSEMEFDGERLARRGIIVVSVNYRLGAFGFLTHPEITAEAPEAPANFGHLDQKAGLMWVVRNIEAFGGDPSNITIAGQSAGGGSTLAQLTHEPNYPYISKAIIMSAFIRNPFEESRIVVNKTLKEAEKLGEAFFAFLGVRTLEEARALDAVFIRDRYAAFREDHPWFMGIIDDVFTKDDPMKLFARGKRAAVPVMSGNTADEFPGKIPGNDTPVNYIESTIKAEALANEKIPGLPGVYYYRFDVDIPGEDQPGTFHSVDLWFFFETLAKCSRAYEGHHYDIARKMCDYWADFIRTGDPNGKDADGSDLPLWKPYTESCPWEMTFTRKGPVGAPEIKDAIKEQALRAIQQDLSI
ncbi:MAG: carboxylesterase family protein [Lachnospiraceae bacterium]|nr:carboxylesterase family protein [Lachnospiraceae bacterium]